MADASPETVPTHHHDGGEHPLGEFAALMAKVPVEVERARANLGEEEVHDLRVALRRCRSIAQGLRALDPHPAWQDMNRTARTLFQRLGELRDTHVMTGWLEQLAPQHDPIKVAMTILLRERETHLSQQAAEAVAAFSLKKWQKLSKVLVGRAALHPEGDPAFLHLALARFEDVRALHRRALRNKSQVGWHDLRIGVKRLRYTIENFLPAHHERFGKPLKKIQDALGEVHDLDVLWDALVQKEFLAESAIRDQWHGWVNTAREERILRYRKLAMGRNGLWQRMADALPRGAARLESAEAFLEALCRSMEAPNQLPQRQLAFSTDLLAMLEPHLPVHLDLSKTARLLTVAELAHTAKASSSAPMKPKTLARRLADNHVGITHDDLPTLLPLLPGTKKTAPREDTVAPDTTALVEALFHLSHALFPHDAKSPTLHTTRGGPSLQLVIQTPRLDRLKTKRLEKGRRLLQKALARPVDIVITTRP